MWVETPGSAGREQRGCATATGAGPRRCSCTRQPVPSSSRARDVGLVWGKCWELRPSSRCSRPAWEGAAFPRGDRHTSSTPALSHFISTSPPRHGSTNSAPWGQGACEVAGCCCSPLPVSNAHELRIYPHAQPCSFLLFQELLLPAALLHPHPKPQMRAHSRAPGFPFPFFSPYNNNRSTLQDPACAGPFPTTPSPDVKAQQQGDEDPCREKERMEAEEGSAFSHPRPCLGSQCPLVAPGQHRHGPDPKGRPGGGLWHPPTQLPAPV